MRRPASPTARQDATACSQLLSLKQAAALLAVSKRTLWSWIASGKLPAVRLSTRVTRVESSTIADLIASSRVEGGN